MLDAAIEQALASNSRCCAMPHSKDQARDRQRPAFAGLLFSTMDPVYAQPITRINSNSNQTMPPAAAIVRIHAQIIRSTTRREVDAVHVLDRQRIAVGELLDLFGDPVQRQGLKGAVPRRGITMGR